MPNLSVQAWQQNQALYRQILNMPFNAELTSGTLTRDRFQHYIIQDAHYLEGFARTLSIASAKGLNSDHVVHFAGAAQTAIIVERSLHADYFQLFGVTSDEFAAVEPTPVCEHYVSYLIRTASLETFEVTIAALLPCFWVYCEVGKDIFKRSVKSNPYQAWIDTYAGEDFEEAVQAVIKVFDEVAESASGSVRQRMLHAFRRAVQLEWMFWDSAHRLAVWPV